MTMGTNSMTNASRAMTPDPQDDPLRILVIEDHRFDREKIGRFAAQLKNDVQITDAPTLARAIDFIGSQQFDLIFLDYSLPDGLGLDAMEIIRLSEQNCTTATIMITGQDMEGLAAEALRCGCCDYIAKTDLTLASFTRATTNALQKSRLTQGIATQTLQRREVEAVLQKFSSECAREVKPMVSRMMRQLRGMRDGSDTVTGSDSVAELEVSCMRLWEFLVALENYKSADFAEDFCTHPEIPAAPASKHRASLFGRA